MKDCSLPTRKECLALLAEYHVPPHMVNHCRAVAKLALFLAQMLNENSAVIDIELLERACLLHDMMRVFDFQESDYHQFARNLPPEEKTKWESLSAKYKTIIPMPPNHCVKLLQKRSPLPRASMFTRIEAPVVVKPDMDSKAASTKEGMAFVK